MQQSLQCEESLQLQENTSAEGGEQGGKLRHAASDHLKSEHSEWSRWNWGGTTGGEVAEKGDEVFWLLTASVVSERKQENHLHLSLISFCFPVQVTWELKHESLPV